jgi:hypothetical protein
MFSFRQRTILENAIDIQFSGIGDQTAINPHFPFRWSAIIFATGMPRSALFNRVP